MTDKSVLNKINKMDSSAEHPNEGFVIKDRFKEFYFINALENIKQRRLPKSELHLDIFGEGCIYDDRHHTEDSIIDYIKLACDETDDTLIPISISRLGDKNGPILYFSLTSTNTNQGGFNPEYYFALAGNYHGTNREQTKIIRVEFNSIPPEIALKYRDKLTFQTPFTTEIIKDIPELEPDQFIDCSSKRLVTMNEYVLDE